MRFIKTVTVEINEDAETIGEVWGISDKRALELKAMLAEWIAESEKWSEIYTKIFSELEGNEAVYAFGFLNYLWGVDDGKKEAVMEFIAGLGGEGA